MDKDQTGTIDWWEFLNHEALKIISKNRSKVGKTFLLYYHYHIFTSTHHNTVHIIDLSRKLQVMSEEYNFFKISQLGFLNTSDPI